MDIKIGDILIAEPFMNDPNFKEAVILICDIQEEDGTLGFILNKPIDMLLHELVDEFPDEEMPVYFGGPVGLDTIYFVHRIGDILDDSVKIGAGLYWGGNFEKLKILIDHGLVKKNDIKFFVGYSGWTPNQLKEEIKMGSWVRDKMDPNYLYEIPDSKLWTSSMENKGDSFGIIAEIPKNISWN